jgi:hypothetical protein
MFTNLTHIARRACGALSVAMLAVSSQLAAADKWPSVDETRKIAEAGYIYGKPSVMNYAVMYAYAVDKNSGQFKAPFNQILNMHEVATYKDTAVITPNSDTPYSVAWVDLRAEPIVLSVPKVEKDRYYAVQLIDSNAYNYGYIGSRATGSDAGTYMVVAPGWQGETPKGIDKVFRATTDFSLVLYRTQLKSPDDMPNVIAVQEGYKMQPLSAYLGTNYPDTKAPPAAPAVNWPKVDDALVKTNFFDYLDLQLRFAPADAAPASEKYEQEIRGKLAKIGIGPGKSFDFKDLPASHKQAVAEGMKAGEAKIQHYLQTALLDLNGWKIGNYFGDAKFINGDWLKRAGGATAGIYGNDPAEAAYPLTKHMPNGDLIDGSVHNYTLTFPAGQYPPVNAFWSVTMYDGKTQLLIKNPLDRYLINSPMLPQLKKNPDGSLTMYIQHKSPGKDKESNWLPAPDGPIYLVLRMYWPKTEAPSILPLGKGTWKPPEIKVAP